MFQIDYVQMRCGGRTQWSDLFVSDVTGANIMAVAAPVMSRGCSGNMTGILNITIDEEQIGQILHGGLAN